MGGADNPDGLLLLPSECRGGIRVDAHHEATPEARPIESILSQMRIEEVATLREWASAADGPRDGICMEAACTALSGAPRPTPLREISETSKACLVWLFDLFNEQVRSGASTGAMPATRESS